MGGESSSGEEAASQRVEESVPASSAGGVAGESIPEVPNNPPAVIVHPIPPYSEASDELLAGGLNCYYEDCKFKGLSYSKIMSHVRTQHKQLMKNLSGTYFHKKAAADIAESQRKLWRTRAQERGKGEGADDDGRSDPFISPSHAPPFPQRFPISHNLKASLEKLRMATAERSSSNSQKLLSIFPISHQLKALLSKFRNVGNVSIPQVSKSARLQS